MGVVQEESPDLSVEEMLGMGVGVPKKRGREAHLSVASVEEEGEEGEERKDLSVWMLLRAIGRAHV